MINQYFSGFFQSFLRVNGTIGSNFQYQLFVVSLLFNTEVFHLIFTLRIGV